MFKTPLRRRMRQSELRRQRYHSDPEYRLRLVNDKRVRRGQEPLTSLDQVGEDFRAHVASRQRDEKGRYA